MKISTKIILILFFIFGALSAYTVKAQGFSDQKINVENFITDHDVLLYPNPVTEDKFYLKSETVIKVVEVMNVLGQNIKTVYNETNVAYNILVELNDAKEGMYMVKITFSDKQTIIRKIIVK